MKQLSETRRVPATDGVDLAYRVIGDGPVDLIWSFNQLNDVEVIAEHPPILEYLDALAGFARVVVYDRRGMGRSGGERGDLATDIDDLLALLDHVGAGHPYLASAVTGGAIFVAFAAAHPERVAGVVWHGAFAQSLRTESYPWGASPGELEDGAVRVEAGWGSERFAERFVAAGAPSRAGDEESVRFYAHWMRRTATPRDAATHLRTWDKIDLHPVLREVRTPVLVLDRANDPGEGAYVASLLARGRFLSLDGPDFIPYYESAPIVAAIREFVGDTQVSDELTERPNPTEEE
ncbi:MAG: alpha/beta hydrolase [Chloroflexi bacterium]|nr:alpha/beta hydrolase [Chloroflexota bacterium]